MSASNTEIHLADEQRRRLAALADYLISGGAGLPAASEADVQGAWIDRALAARPDMVPVVQEVLAKEGDPTEVMDALREKDREKFDAFAFIVSGAYLINPRVRKILGYPGPAPAKNPAFPDEADSYLEDGILDAVVERGPIYRATPSE